MSDNFEQNSIDDESREMLKSFVSEAFDSLDTNEPIVETLRNEDNSEFVNAIFRVFHTLKGLSGFFEMKVINKVTHEAETLLDIIRRENKVQTEDTISVIYSTFDFLRELLSRVSEELTDISGVDEAEDMILVLRDQIEKVKNPVNLDFLDIGSPKDYEMAAVEDIPEQNVFIDNVIEEEKQTPAVNAASTSIEPDNNFITDDLLDQYLTSAFELVDTTENNLIILEKDTENYELIGETFGAVHSLKGNSGFMGFSEIEEIAVEMETILDSVRSRDLEIDQTVITVLLSNTETIRDRLIKKISGNGNNSEAISQDQKKYEVTPEKIGFIFPENDEMDLSHFTTEPIKIVQKETPAVIPPANIPVKTPVKIPEAEVIEPEADDDEKEMAEAVKKAPKSSESTNKQVFQQMQRKDIRVETTKIDKLFDLVGELITIETMVTKNPDLKGLNIPNFYKAANQLNKITRELQEITMSVRMMPLDGLFNKMKRLVRDVALKMGRKVNFEVSGQETEMDKNVIDEVADPLVHILRNSIDHGVESPEKRLAKGKSEFGNISLRARYEGNEILILVKDDGAGIHRNVILKKAEEKGLLTMPAEKMTDKEVFNLLFEPGFSTAATVTDISGRGVGMDVVKKNLEKLRGTIDIDSVPGEGSTFTLRIPLTLAIMEAMLIRVGDAVFALPILSVTESFKTASKFVSKTMDGLEVVRVRDEVMSVVRLHELFDKKSDNEELDKGILIIIESRERKVCLFADEIIGQQQAVIKGLSDYIGKVPGITGCMILGDGGIGLIIDIESLIELSENPLQMISFKKINR